MVLNWPNFLTFLRILFIPFFIEIYRLPFPGHLHIAALIFLMASVTDLLDGYVARRKGQVTKLGKLLDPIADKLLVISALTILVSSGKVFPWLAILLIGREFVVTGLRAIALSEGVSIPVESTGKYKMVLQTSGIFLLLLPPAFLTFDIHLAGTVLLWLATLLAFLSGGQYFIKFWKEVPVRQ